MDVVTKQHEVIKRHDGKMGEFSTSGFVKMAIIIRSNVYVGQVVFKVICNGRSRTLKRDSLPYAMDGWKIIHRSLGLRHLTKNVLS